MKTLALLLTLGAFTLRSATAAEPPVAGGAHSLKEFKLGAHLSGPEVTPATMQGKAVMLDCWGINCGPCLALLPDIEKLSKRYKDKLVVVGAHCQGGTPAQIDAVVKKNKLSYAIVDNVNSPVPFSGLPHVFVFDAQGALVFNGNPMDKDFDRVLRKATSGAGATAAPSGFDSLKRPGT